MTSPGIDPRLVAALVADVAALRGQLDRVSRGLSALQNTLAASSPAPGAALAQAPVGHLPPAQPGPLPQAPGLPLPQANAVPMPPAAAVPVPQAGPMPQMPAGPAHPGPVHPGPAPMASPPLPTAPKQPWWQRDGVVSRILAVAGGVVTLIGLGMLVGLAIQAGWFGPAARVASGGVLSVALVGIAERLIRRPGGRVGALAVGATGIAGLTVTVMAAGDVGYRWLPPIAAVGALVVVTALGLAAARHWSAQSTTVVTAAAVSAFAWPTVGDHPLLVAPLLLGLQVAVLLLQYPRVWPVAYFAAALVPMVALMPATSDFRYQSAAVLLSLVAMVIAVVAATATLRRVDPQQRGLATAAGIGVVVPILPLLVALGDNSPELRLGDLAILAIVALVTGVAAMPIRRSPLPVVVRISLGVVAVICVLRLALAAREPITTSVVLMLVAVVLLAIAVATRSMAGWATGWLFGVLGLITAVDSYGDGLLSEWLRDDLDGGAAMVGVLTVLAAGAGIVAGRRLRNPEAASDLVIAGQVLIGLLGVTLTTVAVGTLINPEPSGWVAGHCAATVAWMAVAVASLQRGLVDRDNPRIWLIAGLGLAAMATAKLFLFDLASLGGVPRALAFLLVGVLLLVAGTRYARSFAERRGETEQAASGRAASGQPGPPAQ
ncbi:DUF2339 domain-containing protein [Millisia brevis]|uniref:DUF2339 domain-containing protein n=1 Tax=Millisia brevis TaxID=264148 RepID=UPI000833F934|nr:DUF2339 domain-containing protein [Millisia brevis]